LARLSSRRFRDPRVASLIYPFAPFFTIVSCLFPYAVESQYDRRLRTIERQKQVESRQRELEWLAGYTPAAIRSKNMRRVPRIGRPRALTAPAVSTSGIPGDHQMTTRQG
jgi:hypothetical protein